MSYHVFFGGTFCPPHIGHHQILKSLLCQNDVSKVHVVPTSFNHLKKSSELLSASDRLSLMNAWVEQANKEIPSLCSKLSLETFELNSAEPSYTVDSLKHLQESNPNTKWILVIGADLLRDLSKWKSIHQLLSMIHSVWLYPRAGFDTDLNVLSLELRSLCGWRVMDDQIEWISSTDIRRSEWSTDATQAKLKPYLLDNVFDEFVRLLQQKKRE